MNGLLKCTIMYFFEGSDAPLDDDNMVKPIRDALNRLVYNDDEQSRHSHTVQVSINEAFRVRGAPRILLNAFSVGVEFVYVRIEDAPAETSLPRSVDAL